MNNNIFDTMEDFKNQLISIDTGKYSQEQLLSILLLCTHKLDINTVSEMARKLNKTPKGLRESKQYRKVNIGKQLFIINGLKENELPF